MTSSPWGRARRWALRCPRPASLILVFPSQLRSGFGCDDATRILKLRQACAVVTMSTMVLSETRGLWLSWVIRGGIGLTRRLGARGTCLQALWMLTLEPERLKNRLATTRTRSPEMDGTVPRDAQAACDFSFSASKSSPFFQSVSVMAAILRASVRRAMVGSMPLATEA